MRSNTKIAAGFVVLLALVAAACSSSSDLTDANAATADESALVATTSRPAAGDAAPSGTDGTAEKMGDGGIVPTALQTATIGRDIIFTAEMTVAVDDVAAAGREATRVIEGLGGFLFGQQTTGAPEARSTLTFKIRPDDFQEALLRLGSIGEIRDQSITADDVTERIVDLASRITTTQASVTRLRGFLEEASDIKTVSELETQLLQRETDLETMRAQLRTIQNRVDLATIVVILTETSSRPAMEVVVTAYPGTDGGASCPGDAGVTVDEGQPVTVCWEITNTGDTALADFTISDNVLGIGVEDLVVVFGDPTAVLETGQSIVLAHELVLERDLRTQTRISAVPVNEDGTRLEGRSISRIQGARLSAVDPGGLPGFGDGLATSWSALRDLGGVLVLAAGSILPFLWLPILAWLYVAWRRKRRAEVTTRDAKDPTGSVAG